MESYILEREATLHNGDDNVVNIVLVKLNQFRSNEQSPHHLRIVDVIPKCKDVVGGAHKLKARWTIGQLCLWQEVSLLVHLLEDV